jgi:hypothetical protein
VRRKRAIDLFGVLFDKEGTLIDKEGTLTAYAVIDVFSGGDPEIVRAQAEALIRSP